jgi:hypothetical protein
MPEMPLPQDDKTSLVLIGAFNPRIFHPAWFARNGLLPPDTESTANIEIVNNDISAFESDWFRIEVLSNRFALRSMATPAVEALRDLLLGTFVILHHTPVEKIGLNTHAHYALPTERTWHEFGHRLAPKTELWDPILQEPGTLSVTIQGVRPDGHEGHMNVKVEPSAHVEYGIYLETNDEYRQPQADSANWLADILSTQWDASRQRAADIRTHVLNCAYGASE